MSRYHVYTNVLHENGTSAPAAVLSVYADQQLVNAATLYAASTGSTALDNPYTVPASGVADFWIDQPSVWILPSGDSVPHEFNVNTNAGAETIYNVNDYGALGDGTTDDTVAIQAAVDAMADTNGGILYFPNDTYRTTNCINITQSNTTVELNGATIYFDNSTNVIQDEANREEIHGMFYVYGGDNAVLDRVTAITTAEFNESERHTKVTVEDASDFAPFDYVRLTRWDPLAGPPTYATSNWYPDIRIATQIYDIDYDTNIVTLAWRSPLDYSWINLSAEPISEVGCLTLRKLDMVENVIIQNGILYDAMSQTNYTTGDGADRDKVVCGVGIDRAANVTVRDIWATKTKFPVVLTRYAHRVHVENLHLEEANYIGPGEGYAVQFVCSQHCSAKRVTGNFMRHLVDFAWVGNGYAEQCYSPCRESSRSTFKIHGFGEHDIVFRDCFGQWQLGVTPTGTDTPGCAANVTLDHCQGSVLAYDIDNFTVTDSDLAFYGTTYAANVKIIDTRITLGVYGLWQPRKRGRTMRTSGEVRGCTYYPEVVSGSTLSTGNGFEEFEDFWFVGNTVDFTGDRKTLRLVNIKNLVLADNVLVNTMVLTANEGAKSIHYRIRGNRFETTTAGYVIANNYPDIISIYRIHQATGLIDISENSFINASTVNTATIYPLYCPDGDGYFDSSVLTVLFRNNFSANSGTGLDKVELATETTIAKVNNYGDVT